MARKIILVAAAGLVAAAIAAAALVYANHRAGVLAAAEADAFRRSVTAALDDALARQQTALDTLSARFERIDDLKTAQELRLRRYNNAAHLGAARTLGRRVSGHDEAERLAGAGRLVRIEDNPYYALQDFDYSVPYVTPDAAALLRELGERFHAALRAAGLPLYRYEISSVLRTAENQAALRGINPNATYGVSTHEFGTTVDVVYHTYHYVPRPEDALPATPFDVLNPRLEALRVRAYDALGMRYWQELQGLLGRVLIELQDEGKVMVTLEREQPVFHFTVSARLADD